MCARDVREAEVKVSTFTDTGVNLLKLGMDAQVISDYARNLWNIGVAEKRGEHTLSRLSHTIARKPSGRGSTSENRSNPGLRDRCNTTVTRL